MNISPGNSISAVLACACSVSYLFCGLYILSPAMKDKRIRTLFYLCVFCSLWCITYILYFLSADSHMMDIWQRLTYAGMFYMGFPIWFFVRYLGLIKNKKIMALVFCMIWLPPLVIAYKSVAENAIALDFPSGFWFLYTWIQTTAYNCVGIVLVLLYHLKHRTNKSRRQTLILIPSAVLCMVFAWIFDYYFGSLKIRNVSPLWLLIWVGILLYTIRKYRFITVKPDFINKDLSENIEEGIILLDPDFSVIFTNRAIGRLLNRENASFTRLNDVVAEPRILDGELATLKETTGISVRLRIRLLQDGSPGLPVDVAVKKVIDAFKDTTGFLLIVSTIKDMEHLKTRYGISDREMDVILQLAAGKTSKDISGYLFISERTVEAHIRSIYDKLGVKNRVGFLNLVSEYDV